MQVTCHREQNLSYIVIDDYLTDEEHKEVLAEIKDLRRFSVPAKKIDSATDENGNFVQTGNGVFVDPLYPRNNRESSPILCMGQKIFSSELGEDLEKFDVVFGKILESNHDSILINYYCPGQIYKAHKDNVDITTITLLGWGEFTGGGFCFPDQNVKIEFKQGRTIIFPSIVNHASEPLIGGEESCRISVAHFIWNDNGDWNEDYWKR
tara:strand:- start:680 stop:1303 length:624 start_codon:yes stop_codon:yes gene_type:complete